MTASGRQTESLYSPLAADPDLREIVALFVQEMPQRVATLLERLDCSDWEGLRRAAHQLKGAAGSYGFALISPAAARVEEAVRQGRPEQQIRQSVAELIELCRRARAGTPEDAADI
ncbi:MAG: Hpt domain-containing protein [Thermoguttaceae bacterium]